MASQAFAEARLLEQSQLEVAASEAAAKRQKTEICSFNDIKEVVLQQSKQLQDAVMASQATSMAIQQLVHVLARLPQLTQTPVSAALPQPNLLANAGADDDLDPTQRPADEALGALGRGGVQAAASSDAGKPLWLKKMPEDLCKEIEKAVSEHEKVLRKHLKNEKSIEKSANDLLFFEKHSKELSYPKGMKAFKSNLKFAELDEPVEASKLADFSWTITVEKGTSRRAAMQKLHWSASRAIKQLDSEALLHHRQNLREKTAKIHLLGTCGKLCADYLNNSAVTVPGLDAPAKNRWTQSCSTSLLKSSFAQ